MTLDLTKREVPIKTYQLTPEDATVPERVADVIARLQKDGLLQGMATQERNRLIEAETRALAVGVTQAQQASNDGMGQRLMVATGISLLTTGSKAIGTVTEGPWEIVRATVLVTAVTGTLTTSPRFGLQCAGADVFATKTHAGTPAVGGKWRLADSVGYSPPVEPGDALTLNVTTAPAGLTALTASVYIFGHKL